ncbi:MAG: hypothetical protein FWE47_00435, partial [Oscillospiraceae bacterium]|nr:hypothetical protein [Oscillospiraceae bacterium]
MAHNKKALIWLILAIVALLGLGFCALEISGVTQVFIKPTEQPKPTEAVETMPKVIEPSKFGQRVDAPVAAPKNVLSTNLGLRWNWGEGGDGSFAGFGMSASV